MIDHPSNRNIILAYKKETDISPTELKSQTVTLAAAVGIDLVEIAQHLIRLPAE